MLMVVCDAKYFFTHVHVGAYGTQTDGGIFINSQFGYTLNNDLRPLPSPIPLRQLGTPTAHYFLGDEAFPPGGHVQNISLKGKLHFF